MTVLTARPEHAARFLILIVDQETGCVLWTGSQDGHGYGQIRIGRETRKVHKVMYELFVGPVPEGLQIDHLCRVRHCASPAHLEAVTPVENTRRGEPAQRTNCPQGHAYDDANTYWFRGRARQCRSCRNARQQQRRAEQSS